MPVVSDHHRKGAKEAEFPKKIQPMLLHSSKEIITRPGWLYEPKFDGMRAIVFVQKGKCRILSRNGRDITLTFPELIEPLQAQPDCVLDAELVVMTEAGTVDFEALQNRWLLTRPREIAARTVDSPAVLFVFDMLHSAGMNLTDCRLQHRKEYLDRLLKRSQKIQYVPVFDDGHALFEAGRLHKLEGVISKRADSTYREGIRSRDWVKTKYFERGTFVIVGHKADEGFLVAKPDAPNQIVGIVQYGFSESDLKQLRALLQEIGEAKKGYRWFAPTVQVSLEFMQWTKAGKLRFPIFKGF